MLEVFVFDVWILVVIDNLFYELVEIFMLVFESDVFVRYDVFFGIIKLKLLVDGKFWWDDSEVFK